MVEPLRQNTELVNRVKKGGLPLRRYLFKSNPYIKIKKGGMSFRRYLVKINPYTINEKKLECQMYTKCENMLAFIYSNKIEMTE